MCTRTLTAARTCVEPPRLQPSTFRDYGLGEQLAAHRTGRRAMPTAVDSTGHRCTLCAARCGPQRTLLCEQNGQSMLWRIDRSDGCHGASTASVRQVRCALNVALPLAHRHPWEPLTRALPCEKRALGHLCVARALRVDARVECTGRPGRSCGVHRCPGLTRQRCACWCRLCALIGRNERWALRNDCSLARSRIVRAHLHASTATTGMLQP